MSVDVTRGIVNDNPHNVQLELPLALCISAFTAVAWVYTLELLVRSWFVFKKYAGLYFWSLQVCACGIIVHATAILIMLFNVMAGYYGEFAETVLLTLGWWPMVTGQSLVLYSRLHLLVIDKNKLRWVLYMIICNAFLFHAPTTVLTFGSKLVQSDQWTNGFKIMEKIQMTAFSIQEIIISTMYAWETSKMLKPRKSFERLEVRRMMRHLLYVNIFIIFLDLVMLACQYADQYVAQAMMKSAIYAIKLRLEFPILNQLTSMLARGSSQHQISTTQHGIVLSSAPNNANHYQPHQSSFPHAVSGTSPGGNTDRLSYPEETDEAFIARMDLLYPGRSKTKSDRISAGTALQAPNMAETPSTKTLAVYAGDDPRAPPPPIPIASLLAHTQNNPKTTTDTTRPRTPPPGTIHATTEVSVHHSPPLTGHSPSPFTPYSDANAVEEDEQRLWRYGSTETAAERSSDESTTVASLEEREVQAGDLHGRAANQHI